MSPISPVLHLSLLPLGDPYVCQVIGLFLSDLLCLVAPSATLPAMSP
jgi:hypothetical protein